MGASYHLIKTPKGAARESRRVSRLTFPTFKSKSLMLTENNHQLYKSVDKGSKDAIKTIKTEADELELSEL